MSKSLRQHREVRVDVTNASAWYEQERAGLGRELIAEVRTAFRELLENGTIGSPLPRGSRQSRLRRLKLARFPYHVIFVESETERFVVAVAHFRREEMYWRKRLPLTDA